MSHTPDEVVEAADGISEGPPAQILGDSFNSDDIGAEGPSTEEQLPQFMEGLVGAAQRDEATEKLLQKAANAGASRKQGFVPLNPFEGEVPVMPDPADDDLDGVELSDDQQQERGKQAHFEEKNRTVCEYLTGSGFNHNPSVRGTRFVHIAHTDDDSIVFYAGRHLHVAAIDNPSVHRVLPRAPRCIEILTFCVSSNGKYVAVSERMPDAPHVSLYKVDSGTRITSLNFKHLASTQIVALSFASNNKFLATVTAAPQQRVVYWQLHDVKVIGSHVIEGRPVRQVSVDPWASFTLATTSADTLQLWKLVDRAIEPMRQVAVRNTQDPDTPHDEFIAHCWYDENCVATLSAAGRLCSFDDCHVESALTLLSPCSTAFSHLVWASRGLLAAGTHGVLILADRTYDPEKPFVQTAAIMLGHGVDRPAVMGLSVAPAEHTIVIALSNNTVSAICVDDMNTELELAEHAVQKKRETQPASVDEVQFSDPSFVRDCPHLAFHTDLVTSMSCCVQRPLVLTTSLDKTVRVYNYETRATVLHRRMEDEVLCGAVNPMGLAVVLGFRFYTRVYALLEQDLHLVEDLPIKPCHEARYSHGGGRVVLCSSNRVYLYDAHSYQCVGQLSGHITMVKSVAFTPDDTVLVTCDTNGLIYTWSTDTMLRGDVDSNNKALILQQALYHPGSGLFAAVGSARTARGSTFEGELTIVCATDGGDESKLVYLQPGILLPKPQALRKGHFSLLAFCETTSSLFVGTPAGRLLVYSFPLLKSSKPYAVIDSHNCEITHIQLSPDERFLFTVGADNVMCCFSLLHMAEGQYITPDPFNYEMFSGVKYQHVHDFDTLDREAFALRRRVEERQAENEGVLEDLRASQAAALEEQRASYDEDVQNLREELEATGSEAKQQERELTSQAHKLESDHATEAESIEVLYSKRAREAHTQIEKLEIEKDELAAQYETRIAVLSAEAQAQKQKLEQRVKERCRTMIEQQQRARRNIKETAKRHDALLCQTVVDFETQRQLLQKQHLDALSRNDEQAQRAQTTATFGDKEAERLRRDLLDLHQEANLRADRVKDLHTALERQDKETHVLRKELLLKQETINVAEKRLQGLKLQLSKLENLRFVLSHQYEELRKASIPAESNVRQLEETIRDREEEIQSTSFERNRLQEQVAAIETQVEECLDRSNKARLRDVDDTRRMKVFGDELGRLLDRYTDAKSLHTDLRGSLRRGEEMFDQRAAGGAGSQEKQHAEFAKHTKFMKAQRELLREEEHDVHRQAREVNEGRIVDNTDLMVEIQHLRTERKTLIAERNLAEVKLRDTCVALHRLAQPKTATQMLEDHTKPARALLPPIGTPTAADTPKKMKPKGGKPLPVGRRAVDTAQLEVMVSELDHNTSRMRSQRSDVLALRVYVQELLQHEEQRVVASLGQHPAGSLSGEPPITSLASGDTDMAPSWAPETAGVRPMTPPIAATVPRL